MFHFKDMIENKAEIKVWCELIGSIYTRSMTSID